MKNRFYCKIPAVGIIILFVGVGIHPAFAVEDKTTTSKNDNPINVDGEILENTNCFVMGRSRYSLIWKGKNVLNRLFIRGMITFGYCHLFGNIWSAEGWIYTRNVVNKWGYIGYFHGKNGEIKSNIYHVRGLFYIGIKNFTGIAFFKKVTYYPDIIVTYIGFAESVKIKVDEG